MSPDRESGDDALTGGRWITRRGVRRWVADDWPPLTLVPEPKPKPDLTKLIACPYCRAKVSETCKSMTGNPRVPHAARLAPRLCLCGALPAAKKQMCEPCREAARHRTYRLREIRQPTRDRRKESA